MYDALWSSIGLYKIHIKFFGRDVPGSPFSVEVFGDTQSKEEMIRDVIQNVKISGSAARNGKPLITNQFLLDPRNAIVAGGLSAHMQGPGHIEVDFKENLDGKYVMFCRREHIRNEPTTYLQEQFMCNINHQTVECTN